MKNRVKSKIKLLISNLFGEDVYGKLYAFCQSRRLQKGRNKYSEAEINLLPSFVRSGDVVIDIGANFGQYTYPLSKLVGVSGRVFSFEPVRSTFKILQNIIKRLKLTNVELLNLALGENNGEVEFIIPIDSFGVQNIYCAHLCGQKENIKGIKETVRMISLDELRAELPLLRRAVFIKCDVEGQELMVLKGGRALLSECHPIIFCEIEEKQTRRYGYAPEDLFAFLKTLGYEVFVFVSNKLVPTQGVQDSISNYIFISRDNNGLSKSFDNHFKLERLERYN